VESVKAVSEIFAPVSGEIIEVNSKLLDSPEMINESPHEQAWMVKIRLTNPDELRGLLSAEEYEEYLEEQAEA
jgi:glycine cleavage system H protein